MAHFYVVNSLNYGLSVKFNITLRYFVIKGEEGEHMWTLEIGTTHLNKDGGPISPRRIHTISIDNLDEIIERETAEMCKDIDWSPLTTDKLPPFVSFSTPTGDNVDIDSNVLVSINDSFQSAGIDMSEVNVKLHNGTTEFDITDECEVSGGPFTYDLFWKPSNRVRSKYN